MTKLLPTLALTSLIAIVGCSAPASVENVPVGSEVEVIRQDGGVVRGTLAERDEKTVKVDVGRTSRSVPREEISEVRVVDEAKPPVPLPPVAKFREFTLPAGTNLVVRLDSAVASDTSRVEDPVEAILSDAVVIDGITVLPAGSVVKGEVASAQSAGTVKGRASLALRCTSITISGRDERPAIMARTSMMAPATKADDAKKIAIPAVGGAIIGGIIGGKKGAVIGTAIGGGGGAAVVLSTSGDEIQLTRGTALTLSLDEAVEVRVPITESK